MGSLFRFQDCQVLISCTSSFTRFARSATSPSFAYMSNPAPDSSLCRAAAPRLRLLQLLFPNCIDPLQLLLPICIPSASAAAPCLHPLQLLLAACIRFSCCFPIASASTPIASPPPPQLFWKIPAHARAQCSPCGVGSSVN